MGGVSRKVIFPDINNIMVLPAFFDIMNPWLAGIAAAGVIAAAFAGILAVQLRENPHSRGGGARPVWLLEWVKTLAGSYPFHERGSAWK